jgi:MFS family permease
LKRAAAWLRSNERLALIMVSTALVMAGQGAMAPVLPLFAKSLGVGAAGVGVTLSVFGLARALLNVPFGALADRRGRRTLLVNGPLVSALGMLGSGFAGDLIELVLWRFVAGAGSAMYMTGAQIYLADISGPENRARVIGANQGALLFGVSIGPGIGGLIAELLGLRAPFFAVAVAAAVAALYAWLRLPETAPPPQGNPEEADGAAGQRRSRPGRELLRSRDFLAVSAVTFAVFFTRAGGRLTLMPLLAAAQFGYSAGTLGVIFTAMSLVNLAGIAPAAHVADRFGRKRAIVPSAAGVAIALLMMAGAQSHAIFLASAGLLAVATSIVGPAPAAYAADIAPPALRGIAMGLYRTAGDIGFLLGPVLLGVCADATSISLALTLNAVIVVLSGAFFAVAARERSGRNGDASQWRSA